MTRCIESAFRECFSCERNLEEINSLTNTETTAGLAFIAQKHLDSSRLNLLVTSLSLKSYTDLPENISSYVENLFRPFSDRNPGTTSLAEISESSETDLDVEVDEME